MGINKSNFCSLTARDRKLCYCYVLLKLSRVSHQIVDQMLPFSVYYNGFKRYNCSTNSVVHYNGLNKIFKWEYVYVFFRYISHFYAKNQPNRFCLFLWLTNKVRQITTPFLIYIMSKIKEVNMYHYGNLTKSLT